MSTPKTQRRFLTPNEAAKMEGMELWLINATKPLGNVDMAIPVAGGRSTVVRVAASWVPIDATMFATKDNILASPHFRRCWQVGVVKIADPDYAAEMMRTAEGQAEWNRNYGSDVTVQADENLFDAGMLESNQASAAAAIAEAEQRISPFVLSFITLEHPDEQAISMLRSRSDELTRDDWTYIANKDPRANVKAFAAQQLL